MKIAVLGLGYVGLGMVSALSFANHEVATFDKNKLRNDFSFDSDDDFYLTEPNIATIFEQGLIKGKIRNGLSISECLTNSEIIFITSNTPLGPNQLVDLSNVYESCTNIGDFVTRDCIVVIKSTVPPGTSEDIHNYLNERIRSRALTLNVDVITNPEFIRQGYVIEDMFSPDRVIVGLTSQSSLKSQTIVCSLYSDMGIDDEKILRMDSTSAELAKYASNAMLATRISFINEMANIAELVGADIQQVSKAVGADSRIGEKYLTSGMGFGGSCLPKDLKGLISESNKLGYEPQLLSAIDAVNERQQRKLFLKLLKFYGGAANIRGKSCAFWGIAFKPGVKDYRDSPSLQLIELLLSNGVEIKAYDPMFDQTDCVDLDIVLTTSKEETLIGSDMLIIGNKDLSFLPIDLNNLLDNLKDKVVFDGNNLLDGVELVNEGLQYYSSN